MKCILDWQENICILKGKRVKHSMKNALNIYAINVDRTHDLQIFSLTLSQLSYGSAGPERIIYMILTIDSFFSAKSPAGFCSQYSTAGRGDSHTTIFNINHFVHHYGSRANRCVGGRATLDRALIAL
jgi:hypothetical protein